MKVEQRDCDYSTGKGLVRMISADCGVFEFQTGEFVGPDGIVSISTVQPRVGWPKGTTLLIFAHAGREYHRHIARQIPRRGLARACRKFISDVQDPSQ